MRTLLKIKSKIYSHRVEKGDGKSEEVYVDGFEFIPVDRLTHIRVTDEHIQIDGEFYAADTDQYKQLCGLLEHGIVGDRLVFNIADLADFEEPEK